MKKIAVFLNTIEDYNNLEDKSGEIIYILCDFSQESEFKKAGINYILFDSLFQDKSFFNHDSFFYEFSQNLFKKFGFYCEFEGLNMGEMISWDLKFILSELAFYYKHLNSIIKHYKPDKVYFFNNGEVDKHGVFRFFPANPILEILLVLKKRENFDLKEISIKKRNCKEDLMRIGLFFLRSYQKLMFEISLLRKRKRSILLCGSLRNLRALVKSSSISKNYSFNSILDADAKEFNLSKDFTFLNPSPVFIPSKYYNFFNKKYNEIIKDVDFQKKFFIDGENLFFVFLPRIEKIFKKIMPLMAYYKNYLDKLIKETQPKAVCSMEDVSSFSKLLINVANRKNIPTFAMQYGMYSIKNLSAFWPSDSKYKLLWGEEDKNLFVRLGSNQSNIFVIGEPRFSNYKKQKFVNQKFVRQKLNIPQNKKIVLFTSQYVSFFNNRYYSPGYHLSRREYQESLRILIDFIRKSEDFHLVLSLRPGSDDYNFVNSIIENNRDKITIVDSKEIFMDVLNSSEAVITFWSTTGLEALLLNKILLTFKLKGREDIVDFLKYGAAYGFKDAKELEFILKRPENLKTKKYLNNQKNYLKDHIAQKNNGWEIIDKIINKNVSK